ncbi:unnamed protein product [Victoria cruziana]
MRLVSIPPLELRSCDPFGFFLLSLYSSTPYSQKQMDNPIINLGKMVVDATVLISRAERLLLLQTNVAALQGNFSCFSFLLLQQFFSEFY